MLRFIPLLAILLAPLIMGCQPIGGADPLDSTGRITSAPNQQPEFHGEMSMEASSHF